jgi:2-dehydro-3-deoxyphosphogluconate aldolase/(4S)-4-hydroxy-2-oxoglutarate aldolase
MIELIKSLRIVPVVAISDASKAADLASALVAGGLPIAEITLRTPASLEALKIAAQNKDLLVGVGSLRTGEDLKKAIDVGAQFAVSAGFSPSVAAEASKQGIPYFPGVSTPTEILQAINEGITTLPTGGITAANAKEYLQLSSVVAVGGSWMVAQKLVDAGDFDAIISLTKEAVEVCAQ